MASIVPNEFIGIEDKMKKLKTILPAINKKAGKVIIGTIGDNPEIEKKLSVRYIPTPSKALNLAIAGVNGGIPRGRCTIVAGSPDSGKTSILLETIAKAMKTDPNFVAAWLESEGSLTKDYICGVFNIDPERFVFMEYDSVLGAEDILDLVRSLLSSGIIDMFCINSLQCLVPKKEQEASLKDAIVALQARMNRRMTNKFLALVKEYDTAFCLVCHLSTDIGSMSRDPLVIAGGKAIKHWSSLTLDMRKQSIGPGEPITKEEGVKISVTIRKNHCRPEIFPYKKIHYYAIFGEGIEQLFTTLDYAIQQGIVEQKGAWLYWMKDNEIYERWQGKAAFRTFMRNNPDKFQELSDEIDQSLMVSNVSGNELKEIMDDEEKIEEIVKAMDEAEQEEAKEEKPKKKSKEKIAS